MTKEKWIQSVECWRSIYGQHKRETHGFSLCLCYLTDDCLTRLKPVTNNFLEFSPVMFRVYLPKHHVDLRRAIAYLSDLQHRQAAALERRTAEWEAETAALKTLITKLPGMANEQAIEATKEQFKWER